MWYDMGEVELGKGCHNFRWVTEAGPTEKVTDRRPEVALAVGHMGFWERTFQTEAAGRAQALRWECAWGC